MRSVSDWALADRCFFSVVHKIRGGKRGERRVCGEKKVAAQGSFSFSCFHCLLGQGWLEGQNFI